MGRAVGKTGTPTRPDPRSPHCMVGFFKRKKFQKIPHTNGESVGQNGQKNDFFHKTRPALRLVWCVSKNSENTSKSHILTARAGVFSQKNEYKGEYNEPNIDPQGSDLYSFFFEQNLEPFRHKFRKRFLNFCRKKKNKRNFIFEILHYFESGFQTQKN